MIRKIFITLLLSLMAVSLSGCFDFGDESTDPSTDERSTVRETDESMITVPKAWDTIDKSQFTSNIPDETEMVFRNNVKNETFTANVQILKNQLQEELSSLDYARMVMNRQQDLYDFAELEREERKIKIDNQEENTFIITFEGRKDPDEQLVRYVQTYAVKGKQAYIILAAYSKQENESIVKSLKNIVESFSLK